MEARLRDLRHLQQMGVEKYQDLETWLDKGYAVEFCKHGNDIGCRIYHGKVRSEHPEAGAVLETALGHLPPQATAWSIS
jgi:ribosomal protein L35AE/L33A